ncbi:MAG: DUF4179 domain-containing protein [Shouchella clausii]|jgi:hypothetical protein|uniref:DUF4179 domain-containing protein n=1 Tax=Shouchella clausii TaxID=79880 RepID=UPI000D1EB93E|nr:DUF4179 domain-containing protein [Shouchella clausii]PTL22201.1 hypothetical protein DA802_14190 [Shouchella clausii]
MEPSFDKQIKQEVEHAIRQGILKAEKAKKASWKPWAYSLGASAAAVTLLFGSAYFSPALANSLSQIPVIGSVFSVSGDERLKQASEQGLTNGLDETETINGVAVTLEELLYDQTRISVGFTVKSDEPLTEEDYNFTLQPAINGKLSSGFSGSEEIQQISANERKHIYEFEAKELDSDSFKLGLILENGNGDTYYFSETVDSLDSNQIAVNASQQAEGIELHVESLSLSQTSTSLAFTASQAGELTDLSLPIYDLEFELVDQDGNTIPSYSGGVNGHFEDGVWTIEGAKMFDPLDPSVNKVIVTPVLITPDRIGETDEHMEEHKEVAIEPYDITFEPFEIEIP